MQNRRVGRAPDYTVPALIFAFINLLMALLTIWQVWGLVPALIASWGVNHVITRLELSRRR